MAQFDGTQLYGIADPRRGEHRDWGTLIFNFGRSEVRNFLIANGLFWLDRNLNARACMSEHLLHDSRYSSFVISGEDDLQFFSAVHHLLLNLYAMHKPLQCFYGLFQIAFGYGPTVD